MKLRTQNSELRTTRGFSIVETLVVVFIVTLIIAAVGAFQADVFRLTSTIQSGLSSQNDARKIIRPMADEVRSASEGENGAYALATTLPTTFTFYSDIDGDDERERIRYFLEGSDFKKGVIKPSGSPLSYNSVNEKITEVVHNVVSTDIFTYYDSAYDGTDESLPLAEPVIPSEVRLIDVELVVDEDPNRSPAPITIRTQMSIRNLKDNYEN
jgi:type II secretory pathway pseudopilin PulG